MRVVYLLSFLIIFSMLTPLSNFEGVFGYESFEPIFKNFQSSQSCNCAAFRLDDVQGYWLNEVQISIIETLHEKHVPITIGIIGSETFQFGKDPKITNFVIEKTKEDDSLIEVANHGWEHESFPTFDTSTQSDLIKKSNNRISEILGVYPKVFIPPLNEFNKDTITALEENEMTHFSSMLDMSNPPFPFQGLTVYNFPETSYTGKYNSKLDIFEKEDHKKTLEHIKKSLDSFGYAVITIHPQEFSILEDGKYSNQPDSEKLKDLELLVDEIRRSGLKTVFLSQINESFLENETTIPYWVKSNAGWWANGLIDDASFIEGIQYLIDNEIIVVSTSGSLSGGPREIPQWVKNNAKWWAEGQIKESDFLKAMEFLVNTGIIKINQ